jgi:mercuric ion transport protein
MNVELIYDAECPNVAATRSALIKAFAKTGVSARWREWERNARASPEYVRAFGSPTILVDGKDVADATAHDAASCRVYFDGSGQMARTPPFDSICSALRSGLSTTAGASADKSRWQLLAVSFPAIGTALLPKLFCPLCLPAYTALLSALGLGFVDYTPYLLPLTAIFLAFALGALLIHAHRSGRKAPLLTGLGAAAVVVFGKFFVDVDWMTYAGVGLLFIAIVMTLRKKALPAAACPACVPSASKLQPEGR